MFWKGTVYRHLNRWDNCWALHHNPIHSEDAGPPPPPPPPIDLEQSSAVDNASPSKCHSRSDFPFSCIIDQSDIATTIDDSLPPSTTVSTSTISPPSFHSTFDQRPTVQPSSTTTTTGLPPLPPSQSDSDPFETIIPVGSGGDVSSVVEDSSESFPGDGAKALERRDATTSSSSATSFPDSEEEEESCCPTEDSGAGTSPGQGEVISPPEDYHRPAVDLEEDDDQSGSSKGQGQTRKMEEYGGRHQPRHSYSSLSTSPKGYYGSQEAYSPDSNDSGIQADVPGFRPLRLPHCSSLRHDDEGRGRPRTRRCHQLEGAEEEEEQQLEDEDDVHGSPEKPSASRKDDLYNRNVFSYRTLCCSEQRTRCRMENGNCRNDEGSGSNENRIGGSVRPKEILPCDVMEKRILKEMINNVSPCRPQAENNNFLSPGGIDGCHSNRTQRADGLEDDEEDEVLRQDDENWHRISTSDYPSLGQNHQQQHHHNHHNHNHHHHHHSHQQQQQHPSENPAANDATSAASAIRFCVRSLGWTFVSEKEALLDRGSQSVNWNITGFSLGRHNLNDAVGSWGEGKSLLMELDEENVALLDAEDLSILSLQSIRSIRFWGVGRTNGKERDFAYVAREGSTEKYFCHVFRCDGSTARNISNTLRDTCHRNDREMSRLTARTADRRSVSVANRPSVSTSRVHPDNHPAITNLRPITLSNLQQNKPLSNHIDESKRIVHCYYLGATQVFQPTGVEMLNRAIQKVHSFVSSSSEDWTYVDVAVGPSTITISKHHNSDKVLAVCSVRFLSFMGIAADNVRLCSFVIHSGQDQSPIAHVFYCQPVAAVLCNAIETACKLRYQRRVDGRQRTNFTNVHLSEGFNKILKVAQNE